MNDSTKFKGYELGQRVTFKGNETYIVGFHNQGTFLNVCIFDHEVESYEDDVRFQFIDEVESGISVFVPIKNNTFFYGRWVDIKDIQPISETISEFHILYYANKFDIYCKGVNIKAENIFEATEKFKKIYPNLEPISITIKGLRERNESLNKRLTQCN